MEDISDRHENTGDDTVDAEVRARREFLKKCGKYAVVVPPAMVFLMTRQAQPAFASTGTGTGETDGYKYKWWKDFWGGWF